MSARIFRRWIVPGVCTLATCNVSADPVSALQPGDKWAFYLSEQMVSDDNLYRLADQQQVPSDAYAIGARREDYSNRTAIGMHGRWDNGRQSLLIDGSAADVRYANSDYLNHTATKAGLDFRWHLANRLSGQVGGDYEHTLASYTNYAYFAKDLVETTAVYGDAEYDLGSRFALTGGARTYQARHGAEDRRVDNFDSDGAWGGLKYESPSHNLVALEYQTNQGTFPEREPGIDRVQSQYDESIARVRVIYLPSVKTRLDVMAGYLDRTSDDLTTAEHSGDIWKATLSWDASTQISLVASAWHDLRAYVDAESDYFVSNGASLGPRWRPSLKLQIDANLSWEHQDYISAHPVAGIESRADKVLASRLSLSYQPVKALQLTLSYLHQDRESNRVLEQFVANVAGLDVRVIF
jgi:exopolysaccharide biosynthesis operon protein EpsL